MFNNVNFDKELQAVNRMLRSIDMMQINSWEELDPIGFSAKDELRDVSTTIQSKGWYFNEEKITYTVDENGFIYFPENILSADLDDKNLIKRGNRLYDKLNHTYVFKSGDKYDINVIIFFEFNELPPEAINYITNEATYNFQANVIGNKSVDQNLYNKVIQSLITLNQVDAANRDTSVFNFSDAQNFIRS